MAPTTIFVVIIVVLWILAAQRNAQTRAIVQAMEQQELNRMERDGTMDHLRFLAELDRDP